MSSNEDLQQYIGQNVYSVQKELEGQGYKVHLVRIGRCATGGVPLKEMDGEQSKRAIIAFNGDDPDQKIISIRQD